MEINMVVKGNHLSLKIVLGIGLAKNIFGVFTLQK